MKKKIIFSFLFLLIFFVLIVANVDAVNSNKVIEIRSDGSSQLTGYKYIDYYVKAGDSLYKIALQYGTDVNSIMKLNNLHSYIIYPGQRLTLSVIDQSSKVIYTVKSGDSLYIISRRYNVSVYSIKLLNNLNSDMIYVGQKLEIPVRGDSTDNSNDDSRYSYKNLRGNVILNNKTWDSNIFLQNSRLENKVFPLNEDSSVLAYSAQEVIVKYKAMVNSQFVESFEKENNMVIINSIDRSKGKIVKYRIPSGQNVEELVTEYNKKEDVVWAEPNYIYYPTAIPREQYYNYQWNMLDINMEAAWDVIKGDRSVVVAVLDTGIIPGHPDLKGNLLQGADFVGGVKLYPIESYNINDFDPTDETSYQLGGSHGTHVAGIIGAVTNNDTGVAGVSWNVKILPIRGLTRKGGTSWDIAEGIYYAIDQNVDIINMSFGSNHDSIYQHEAVKDAATEGITVVAAAGNEGSNVYYPAAYPETIAVGAVGRENTKTAYSNYGPEIDIVAPGGDYGESIVSTWGYYLDNRTIADYTGMIGTSMAAPHVSGAAALLVASGINDPAEIRSRLIDNSRDLGDNGKDDFYGYGLLNVYGSLINKKIKNPLVFAADKKDSTLYVKSGISKADDNGYFNLSNVNSNAEYVAAWFDSNNNRIVDAGDYYGEVDNDINDNNIKINIFYLSKDSSYTYYRVVQ